MHLGKTTHDCMHRCRYVKEKDACGADDQYIPYLQLFYCAPGNLWLLMSAFLVIWLLLLFYAMSIVAEVFLCPAVQVGTVAVHLPPLKGCTVCSMAQHADANDDCSMREGYCRAMLH